MLTLYIDSAVIRVSKLIDYLLLISNGENSFFKLIIAHKFILISKDIEEYQNMIKIFMNFK